MIDALNLGGPANLELIHVDEPRELAYWAHVLDVRDDELRKIVNRVGPRAIDVRRHLARVAAAVSSGAVTILATGFINPRGGGAQQSPNNENR